MSASKQIAFAQEVQNAAVVDDLDGPAADHPQILGRLGSLREDRRAGSMELHLDRRRDADAQPALRPLTLQHVEISRLSASATVAVPAHPKTAQDDKADDVKDTPKTETFSAGSYVIRMDQPYSRIADALLDRQYWAPDDPQKTPYDDTGWSLPALFSVEVAAASSVESIVAVWSTTCSGAGTGTSSVTTVVVVVVTVTVDD